MVNIQLVIAFICGMVIGALTLIIICCVLINGEIDDE